MIVKGKRTKRQRPYSSSLTCTSSSGSISSATNLDDDVVYDESTEEEEDMANCLILLAQGGGTATRQLPVVVEETFHSRKFSEMAGFYGYECKTCNRTFPSFQALGGHRASHKKPKAAIITPLPAQAHRECVEEAQFNRPRLQMAKIHECSVCGLEFMSGQALGGHMRRHRAASTSSTTQHVEIKSRDILSLDLNLPAPAEDDSKFHFTSAAQQGLVFSAPALVDCHY